MKLLQPTQKFIDAFPDGYMAENHLFWFNIDLSFIATTGDEPKRKDALKQYVNGYGVSLTYEELMENFNVPFSVFIQEFKGTPIYEKFNFKE